MRKTKILLVDDHKMIRDAIRTYLEKGDEYEVIGEAADGQSAFEFVEKRQPDVVLMDINMEPVDGIAGTEMIHDKFPEVGIIALTMLSEQEHIKKMIKVGARGYLLKTSNEEEVKTAIETVMDSDEKYYSPDVLKIIMESFEQKKKDVKKSRFAMEVRFTAREEEILKLVLKEYTNQEIADQLFVSVRTVDTHKRNLIEKTGSKNLAGLIIYAVEHGFVDA